MGVGRNYVLDLPFQPTEAMTKYTAVKLSGDQTVDLADTIGDDCIGVVQETVTAQDVTDGRVVAVAVIGTTVIQAGAALATVGTKVRASATGQAVTLAAATADQKQLGITLTAAAAQGDWITILLTPGVEATTT
jgi:hypothetical protein